MSKIDDLIAELCPDGVEYLELQEVFDIKNGYTPSKDRNEYWGEGTLPWFRMDDIRLNGRILSDSLQHITPDAVKGKLFPAYSIIIATSATIGEHALLTIDALANQRFTFLTRKINFYDKLDMNFVFYYCFKIDEWCKENTTLGNFSAVDMTKFRRFRLPIPPLSIQEEIVRILDKFSALEAELEKALEAELEKRKKQYEYYRDSLLSFSDDVERKTLGEVGEVTKLAGFEFTEHIKYADEGSIIALRGLNIKKGHLDLSNVKYIDKSNFEKLSRSKLYVNDMLFTYVGTIGEVALIDENDKYYLAPNVARIRFTDNNIIPKFMRYYFQSYYFIDKQINRYLSTSSMKNLTMVNIRKFEIPIPPLIEQERIVAILGRFDTFVNDITQGLPAEIEARRKQYEYYRDKLLTFKEKES